MNKLYFDIETIPAAESSINDLKYLYERKKEKYEENKTEDSKKFPDFEEFYAKTGVDGSFGRIVCIGYAGNDKPAEAVSGDERAQLMKFWDLAGSADLLIGHNIRDFDLPFIIQRSIILGVRPTWQRYEETGIPKFKVNKFLDFARYRSCPIFDTMWEWNLWRDKYENKTIEHLALAMGIPTPKTGIDGSKVYDFYKKGKLDEIVAYCIRDVDTTRLVYKKMIFEGATPVESAPF